MPNTDADQLVMPSILTRLLDAGSMHTAAQEGLSVKQMVDAVRADLEDLFNTRQSGVVVPKQYAETQNSIVTYGLPDMTYFDIHSKAQCERISQMIIALINRFEPRLRGVRVVIAKDDGNKAHQVRCQIEGILTVDPNPEVGFDTVVELTSGKTYVEAKVAPA